MIYGAYCWLTFLVFSLLSLIVMCLVPRLEGRRWIAGATARFLIRAWGIRLRVGGSPLPEQSCIVVANHARSLSGFMTQSSLMGS